MVSVNLARYPSKAIPPSVKHTAGFALSTMVVVNFVRSSFCRCCKNKADTRGPALLLQCS